MVILDLSGGLGSKIVLDEQQAYNLGSGLIRAALRMAETQENVWVGMGDEPEEESDGKSGNEPRPDRTLPGHTKKTGGPVDGG
jgi:hypothetical protein